MLYVSAELRLLELQGGKVRERDEKLKIRLIKDAGCKPKYLKLYDWVIDKYEIM